MKMGDDPHTSARCAARLPSIMTGSAAPFGTHDDILLPRPAAVIFDCDGLLVDTEPCWEKVEIGMVAKYGSNLGPAERSQLIGTSHYETVAAMARILNMPGSEPSLLAELTDSVARCIADEGTPMPGARDLVDAVLATNVPVAVASNSPRHIMEVALRAGGFGALIDVSVCGDDVEHAKPAPDPFWEACRRLGADPASSVAFEDSPPGVASAMAAGLFTICIPSPGVDVPASLTLPTLADPRLLAWVARW